MDRYYVEKVETEGTGFWRVRDRERQGWFEDYGWQDMAELEAAGLNEFMSSL